MEKLGIVITNTLRGYEVCYEQNVTPDWSRSVVDVRHFCPDSPDERLLFLKFVKTGVLVGVMRRVVDRDNDNNAAWIHVPSSIKISGDQLLDVVNTVYNYIMYSTSNYNELSTLFDKVYPSTGALTSINVQQENKNAVLFYGDASRYQWRLEDLLDSKNIYQPEYLQYKYIILLNDRNLKVRRYPDYAMIPDLVELKQAVEVPAPASSFGFTPYVNDVPFDKPISAYQMDTINIVWKKSGYQNVITRHQVASGCAPTLLQNDIKKLVNPKNIEVRCRKTGRVVNDANVFINGHRILSDNQLYLREVEMDRATIRVDHPDFSEKIEQNVNVNGPVVVYMEEKTYTYVFRIDDHKFTCTTNKPLKSVPFKGYQLADDNRNEPRINSDNKLLYKSKTASAKGKTWLFCLVSILLGLLIGSAVLFYFAKYTNLLGTTTTKGPKEIGFTAPADKPGLQSLGSETEKDAKTFLESIEYLDSHDVWDINEMKEYPLLENLWNDMVNRKRSEIKASYRDLLGSQKFTKLYDAILHAESITYKQPQGSTKIDYEKYMKSISRRQVKAHKQEPSTSAGTSAGTSTGTSASENNNSPTSQQDWA